MCVLLTTTPVAPSIHSAVCSMCACVSVCMRLRVCLAA